MPFTFCAHSSIKNSSLFNNKILCNMTHINQSVEKVIDLYLFGKIQTKEVTPREEHNILFLEQSL